MIYFGNATVNTFIHDAMRDGALGLGLILVPRHEGGSDKPVNPIWCADNGAFVKPGSRSTFNEDKWWKFLTSKPRDLSRCKFAVAPDVMGDAEATIKKSLPWLPKIQALGYPAAFVAQDGSENHPPPWDEFDCLFIGGSTEFKLSPVAIDLIAEGKSRGKWVHVGRVNGRKRFMWTHSLGVDSVDGTKLLFSPKENLRVILGWLEEARGQLALFEIDGDGRAI